MYLLCERVRKLFCIHLLDRPQLQPIRFHPDWTRYPAPISDHEGKKKNCMCTTHFPTLTKKSGGNWWKVIENEPYSNVCVSKKIYRFWQISIMKTPTALAASSSCHTVLTARQDLAQEAVKCSFYGTKCSLDTNYVQTVWWCTDAFRSFFFFTFQMSSYIPARGGAADPELRLSIKEVRQRGANRKWSGAGVIWNAKTK